MTLAFADKVHNSKSFQQNGLRPYIEQLATYKDDGQLQVVHTPFGLCADILRKVSEFRNLKNSNILVLFNLEFVGVLLDTFQVKPAKITFAADAETKLEAAKAMGCKTLTVTYSKKKGVEIMPEPKKKFDVVVMNPPYQSQDRKGGGVCATSTLWDKFVTCADNIVDENGYIAAIHPSLWRKPDHPLQDTLQRQNQLIYLEIHNEKDGLKTFGAETRYDWYVAAKGKTGDTVIKDQTGVSHIINLSDMVFLPNHDFDLVKKLTAKDGEEKVEVLHSYSDYESRKKHMSHKKEGKYRYPCVYTVPKNGEPRLMWSSRKSGHFGVPKVIYSTGRPISVGFLLDSNGEYGLTQFSAGIVDTPSNLPKIAKALGSDEFRQFCSAISIGKLEINTSVLRCFRKDFWKEFI